MRERIVLLWRRSTRTWPQTIFTVALVSNVVVGLVEPALRYRPEHSLTSFVIYQCYNVGAPLIAMCWLVRRANLADFRKRSPRNCFLLAAATLALRFLLAKVIAPATMLIAVVLAFSIGRTSFTWHDLLGWFPGPYWAKLSAYVTGLALYFSCALLAIRLNHTTDRDQQGRI